MATPDPFLGFEVIDSPEALDWVKKENAKTLSRLKSDSRYDEFRGYMLKNLDSEDRILYPSFEERLKPGQESSSARVRHFWRDEKNPQGIIKETTLGKYLAGDPQWQTALDFDAISKQENKDWVYSGNTYPFNNYSRCMTALSDGGKDAVEYREFDFNSRTFIKGGFHLPESKSSVSWLDNDTLLVASAFSDDEKTTSGYPRVIKLWPRGTPFSEAKTVYSGEHDDMAVGSFLIETGRNEGVTIILRQKDFYTREYLIYSSTGLEKIAIPGDASFQGIYRDQAFFWLKSDWRIGDKTFLQGSIVYFPFKDAAKKDKNVQSLVDLESNESLLDIGYTDDFLYVTLMRDVQTRIIQYQLSNGVWTKKELPVDSFVKATIMAAPADLGFILFSESGFLLPTKVFLMDEKTHQKKVAQTLQARFEADKYVVKQHFAVSKDGTRVPYFLVHGKDLVADGKNPVLQYGYGGFLNSELPHYLIGVEYCWLRRGGVYVVANIRGGGEYGPAWHDQAVGANRHKAFEDFIAVAEDLITRGITSPEYLGIEGGSNGGLLTGSVMVMRPDLFKAVVMEVPLLDMLRYTKLPPGASWIGEYGDPDKPDDAKFLAAYSPYHNLREGVSYPAPFLMTSSNDDRVHPGHARKFARKLEALGQDFYYFEDLIGGHSGDANNKNIAETMALKWVYLSKRLMDENTSLSRAPTREPLVGGCFKGSKE